MGLRDMLKKKDELDESAPNREETIRKLSGPEFTFIRTDTTTQEILHPPGGGSNDNLLSASSHSARSPRRSLDVFRSSRSRSGSASSHASHQSASKRRLSQKLHLSRKPESSEFVPENLPAIVAPSDPADRDGAELEWEKRATILAGQNEIARSMPSSPEPSDGMSRLSLGRPGRPRSPSSSSKAIDQDIQEAIRLHEEGNLEQSTRIFGRLADPNGANNPLSQVLYGLALRHGWGCDPNPAGAIKFLTAAASNSAAVEQLALQAGMKKGGAAKGELVLAIFELANCFRNGWGIQQDPFAAKQYYETAANLGDTDAMNEAAWCYLEGFGCKKDKYTAARYYRLAEKGGNKILGNTWIWKEKYDSPEEGGGKKKKK